MLTIRHRQMQLLEQAKRRAVVMDTVEAMRRDLPHFLVGLSEREVSERSERTVEKSGRYGLGTVGAVQTYTKLSFVLGADFDRYPPFQALLTQAPAGDGNLDRLTAAATEADWNRAAVVSVMHSRERQIQASRSEESGIRLEPLEDHLATLFALARHPDVWRTANLEPFADLAAYRRHVQGIASGAGEQSVAIVHPQHGCVGALMSELEQGAQVLYFWIGQPYWRLGLAGQALGLHLASAGSHRERIDAYVFEENVPAVKTLMRHGFLPSAAALRSDGLRAYARYRRSALEN
jgi:RimJ/RimL family protein N-acetyltransferase